MVGFVVNPRQTKQQETLAFLILCLILKPNLTISDTHAGVMSLYTQGILGSFKTATCSQEEVLVAV